MKARTLVAAGSLLVSAFSLGPARANTQHYIAGAAAVRITPPHTGNRVGSQICPAAVYTGPSMWDFDEPYIDADGNGEYALGEPFCDVNANGRYDGIWVVGQVSHHARRLNDDLWARTFVVSDGVNGFVAVSSVDSLGLFDTDVQLARDLVRAEHPDVADIIVSADHNESSPDSIGLWGPSVIGDDAPASQTSGVNDYYMRFLARRIADSVTAALADARPALLRVLETTAPTIVPNLNHWPTTNRKDAASAAPNPQTAGRIDAWDPKVGILRAIDAQTGRVLFTVANYAAHIQNLGHSSDPLWGYAITADWVQFFNADVEAAGGGVAIYLQAANGSIETPQVPSRHNASEGTIERSEDIGHELAAVVNAAVGSAKPLGLGRTNVARREFTIPLENQLFIAAFGAHLFPHKALTPAVGASPYPHLVTEVGQARIGALQLLANPGEAFPSLTKGSHWGIDEGCSERPNPPVPSWYSTAKYRWDVGLADDMIGYEIPAWGWDADQSTYVNPLDPCSTDQDAAGNHHHGLEDESTGPTGANVVAQQLAKLAQQYSPGPGNIIVRGRYLFRDGTLSRRPYVAPFASGGVVDPTARAVGIVVDTGAGLHTVLVGWVNSAGSYVADEHGVFVDFDGRPQQRADQSTRGMLLTDGGRTIFVDVYPAFGT